MPTSRPARVPTATARRAVDGEDPDLVRLVADDGEVRDEPGRSLTYVIGSARPISVWMAWCRPLSEL
jgi:hypothetical protein